MTSGGAATFRLRSCSVSHSSCALFIASRGWSFGSAMRISRSRVEIQEFCSAIAASTLRFFFSFAFFAAFDSEAEDEDEEDELFAFLSFFLSFFLLLLFVFFFLSFFLSFFFLSLLL